MQPNDSANPQPAAPGMSPQLQQPAAPAAPGTVAGPMVVQPFEAPSVAATPGRSKLIVWIVAAVAVVVLAAGGLFTRMMLTRITATDVTTALDAANALQADVSDASDAIENITTDGNTAEDVTGYVKTANSKLADAQKQFNTLKTSHALRDKTVKAKFDAFSSKWSPYYAYLGNMNSDLSAIEPISITLVSDLDAMDQRHVTTAAELNDYLVSFKKVFTDASDKLDKVHPVVDTNKQGVALLKSTLDKASVFVDKAITDMRAGNIAAVQSDMLQAGALFNNTDGSDLKQKAQDKKKSLDSSAQLDALVSALNDLKSKTK